LTPAPSKYWKLTESEWIPFGKRKEKFQKSIPVFMALHPRGVMQKIFFPIS
jgi:hypothetical protein